jgi:hypothetical protein
MKRLFILICGLAAVSAAAGEDSRFRDMLASAATNRGNAYLEARAEILAPGTNALPALGRCAVSADLTWQQRLVARICYERLVRGADIEALRVYNWSADPGYNKEWEKSIVGPGFKMGSIVVPKCREVGLWYYYVELTWKETGEDLNNRDNGVRGRWPHWCLDAVAKESERYWYQQVVSERMLKFPFSAWHLGRYQSFLREKDPETVSILVQCYEDYYRNATAPQAFQSPQHAETYRRLFLPILAFADSRHADLLEKFISEKTALEPLKKRLAEVRARPAPPPQVEPPFRLGTNAVVIAP